VGKTMSLTTQFGMVYTTNKKWCGDEIEGWIELLFYPYFGREHWQVR
jgi:hypothetical protein